MGKKGPNIPLIIGIIVVLLIVAILFYSQSQSSVSPATGNVIYNSPAKVEKNCKNVEVPYEVQEEYLKTEYYTERVPYEKDVNLKYTSKKTKEYNCGSLFNYVHCANIEIFNIDTVGGTFRVDCNFRTLHNNFKDSVTNYVKPGEKVNFECEKDIESEDDVEVTYTAEPPTKEVTDYEDVDREREVTAFRPVTKYRTEQVCN